MYVCFETFDEKWNGLSKIGLLAQVVATCIKQLFMKCFSHDKQVLNDL